VTSQPDYADSSSHEVVSADPLSDSRARWRYGLIAVIAGFTTLVVVFGIALLRFKTANDLSSAAAPAVAAIGTLTAAYFGVQAGAAGKEQSDASRDRAYSELLRFAANADPDHAITLLGIVLPPNAPDEEGGGASSNAEAADASTGGGFTFVNTPRETVRQSAQGGSHRAGARSGCLQRRSTEARVPLIALRPESANVMG